MRHDDFFEIGGHSILATRTVARLRQALGRDVPLRLLFESPTVAELARRIGDDAVSEQDVCRPLSARAGSGVFPASLSQASLWFLNELAGPSGVYNIPRAFLLSGALDLAALAASVQALVERHASLRTGFELRDGAPVQVVREFDRSVQAAPIELVPVQGATADERKRFVDAKLRTMLVMEFLVDKVPALDSAWDAIHTFIRIPAGALLAAGATGDTLTPLTIVAGLLGGTLTAGTHFTKTGGRALINTSPEPFSNWGASLAEDASVLGATWFAVYHPLVFLTLLSLFIVLMLWLLPKLWRAVRGVFSALRTRSHLR